MAQLIYSAIASVDGYIEDAAGSFEWAAPDEEVHAFVNDLERPVGTYLYGRRMYETMRYWESPELDEDPSEIARDFATLWRAADKVVFSRTLASASTARTRIVPAFDPALIKQLKASAHRDISIGGPEIAGHALRAGLVDELRLLHVPAVVGDGKPALPRDIRLDLQLTATRSFAGGVVYTSYRVGGVPR